MQYATVLVALFVSCLVAADESVTATDVSSITSYQAANFGTTFGSTCACAILSALFRNKVLYPGTAAYTTEATHYWDIKEALSPKCIFVPATANDVAKGVVALNVCKSQFAVRGGGHMPVKGAANTDGGVLVALTNFNTNVIAADKQSIQSGAGQSWYNVYSALEAYGLYAIGGRLKTIGVGGLTLGGGINYLANKYGFTMDTVIAYEIVLASGQVVTATAKSNSDLFWALKGGGNNFGIVTKFTFSVYSVPKFSTATIVYTENDIPVFTQAIVDLAKYQTPDVVGGAFFTLEYLPASGGVSVSMVGAQAGTISPPPVFNNFTVIPAVIGFYNVSTPAYFHSTLDTPYQELRRLFGVRSMRPNATQMANMFQIYKSAGAEIADVAGIDTYMIFQPIATSIATVAKTNGVGNALGTDNKEPYIWWQINAFWTNSADDDRVTAWAIAIREKIHALNAQLGLATDNLYLNDAGGDQKPFATYPAANLARLKTIRAKYDPTLVFTKLVTGGYKF